MQIIEEQKEDFLISTNKSRLDIEVIHGYLSHSYWAAHIPMRVIKKSIEHSLCFGIYYQDKQIGFSRIISDYATFAYLADVFVLEEYRGKGLSKWMMQVIMNHPELQGLRRWMLATFDAHGLYKQYGFNELARPDRLMEIVKPDIYKNSDA